VNNAEPPKAAAAPRMVLCRQCVEYVYEGTEMCPHCGRDAREVGARYRDGGHMIAEAIGQIERALERRGVSRPTN
jgi:hypothetical protein